jgi:hypothetical protein
MTKQEVIEKYPNQFCLVKYMAIGRGWVPIVEKILERIQALPNSEEIHIRQIKEKFGKLTIYFNKYPEELLEIMREVLVKADTTCEFCGQEAAQQRVGGWIKTICNPCHELAVEKGIGILR